MVAQEAVTTTPAAAQVMQMPTSAVRKVAMLTAMKHQPLVAAMAAEGLVQEAAATGSAAVAKAPMREVAARETVT